MPKSGDLKNRLGEVGVSNEGYSLLITAYRGTKDIDVLVNGVYTVRNVSYQNFKLGKIRYPYHPSVCGKGFLGVGKHTCKEDGSVTHKYKTWSGMLNRCYSPEQLLRCPTYEAISVVEAWFDFQVFGAWYDANYYRVGSERMNLDKDILVRGSKLYSSDTCAFVPQKLNLLFTKNDVNRSDLPIGVRKCGSKYSTYIRVRGKNTNLGISVSKTDAFQVYKEAKEAYIIAEADRYKSILTNERDAKLFEKVCNALYAYEVREDD